MRQILKKIQHFSLFEKSIKTIFKKNFRKHFLNQNIELLIYEDKILIVAIFLFISSSFLYKNKKEKYFYFNWKSYLKIFSYKNCQDFLICAIKYLLESGIIVKNKKEILSIIANTSKPFIEEYKYLLMQKNSSKHEVKFDFDFVNFLSLIDQCLQIYQLRQKDIIKEPSCVVDLISVTSLWKQKLFEIFGNKSEYIVYNFFLNMNI